MALIKIYSEGKNLDELRIHVANSIKLVASAALNVQGVETAPGSVETVCVEGLDLIGIDFGLSYGKWQHDPRLHAGVYAIRQASAQLKRAILVGLA